MPIRPCNQDGKPGHKWGKSGKCYTGAQSKNKAKKQAQAIYASGYKESQKPTFVNWLLERRKTFFESGKLLEQMIQNPLGPRPDDIEDIMDAFSEIESAYANRILPDVKGLGKYAQAQQLMVANYGRLIDVPINSLLPIEPTLDTEHLSRINSSKGAPSSSPMPLVYQYNGKLYINDGNHRIAAAKMRGESHVKVNLVDLNKVQHDNNQ